MIDTSTSVSLFALFASAKKLLGSTTALSQYVPSARVSMVDRLPIVGAVVFVHGADIEATDAKSGSEQEPIPPMSPACGKVVIDEGIGDAEADLLAEHHRSPRLAIRTDGVQPVGGEREVEMTVLGMKDERTGERHLLAECPGIA